MPWANEAAKFLNTLIKDGDEVIVELDRQRSDKYRRILGYVYTVKNGEKDIMLNLEILKNGWATMYQIYPNEQYFGQFSQATEEAIQQTRGIHKFLTNKPLSVNEIKKQKALNKPFLYRTIIEAWVCGRKAEEFLTKWCMDWRTGRIYRPKDYKKVPMQYREFYYEDDLKRMGYL